ncbi:MAG: hypothetical protein F6K21_14580 [Symploca sp. SIO2D2]|nr:hypothetical protein [Symploca sp. SIO2D2]
MNKSVFSFGLVAMLATSLVAGSRADARDIGDPNNYGCSRDAQIIASRSVRVRAYGHDETLTVQMRWSRQCGGRWVRAYIPRGTNLYLKDRAGRRYVNYTAQVHGWNYSNMENSTQQLQACVQHPMDYRELCTDFR